MSCVEYSYVTAQCDVASSLFVFLSKTSVEWTGCRNACLHELHVLVIQFYPDEVSIMLPSNISRGATSHEWIEHNAAYRRACENAGLDEVRREGGEVCVFVGFGSYCPY